MIPISKTKKILVSILFCAALLTFLVYIYFLLKKEAKPVIMIHTIYELMNNMPQPKTRNYIEYSYEVFEKREEQKLIYEEDEKGFGAQAYDFFIDNIKVIKNGVGKVVKDIFG